MRRICFVLAVLLVLTAALASAGCGKSGKDSLVGTWEYTSSEYGINAVYVLKADGTGTYTLKVGEAESNYELKYETKDGHRLVTFVNDEIFTEEDVLDSEYTLKDKNTLVIKDTSGEEMTFIRK